MKTPCVIFSRLPWLLSTFSASDYYHTAFHSSRTPALPPSGSFFLPSACRSLLSRWAAETAYRKNTAETHYARALTRQPFASQVWLAGFFQSLTGPDYDAVLSRYLLPPVGGSLRRFLAGLFSSSCRRCSCVAQSGRAEHHDVCFGKLHQPYPRAGCRGHQPEPWRSPRPHWRELVLESPGVGIGGRLGCPATAGPGLRVRGLRTWDPPMPLPGAQGAF